MATKGKDKIIDGQIAFDFMGELEVVVPKKARKPKVTIETEKPVKAIIKNIFRKIKSCYVYYIFRIYTHFINKSSTFKEF